MWQYVEGPLVHTHPAQNQPQMLIHGDKTHVEHIGVIALAYREIDRAIQKVLPLQFRVLYIVLGNGTKCRAPTALSRASAALSVALSL